MEAGGLANAPGNGVAYPFTVTQRHKVRGFSLGIAGSLATNAIVAGAGPARRSRWSSIPRDLRLTPV